MGQRGRKRRFAGCRPWTNGTRCCQLPSELEGDSRLFVVRATLIYFYSCFCKYQTAICSGAHPGEGRERWAPSGRAPEGVVMWVPAGGPGRSVANLLLPSMAWGFQPSPARVLVPAAAGGRCSLEHGLPIPAASAGSDSLGWDDLGDGDRTRGAIKEIMKLFKLLGRHLLRSPPEPGWSPAC